MCSTDSPTAVAALQAAMGAVVATDVGLLDDTTVRDNLLSLIRLANQINAAIWAHTAVFDARGLSTTDGFKTTRAWLRGYTRLMPAAATQIVRRAQVLRELPALAAGCARGDVCADQVARVVNLAQQVGLPTTREHDTTLAALAATSTASEIEQACQRIRAHADPDGPEPRPDKDWQQRTLTVSRRGNHVTINGRLDLQAGAALITALDALMRPPTSDDDRTTGQRRADAMADLVLGTLNHGCLPTVRGRRPHIGVLITPTTLQHTPTGPPSQEEKIAAFLRQVHHHLHPDHHNGTTPPTGNPAPTPPPPNDPIRAQQPSPAADAAPRAGQKPPPNPSGTNPPPPAKSTDPVTAAGFPPPPPTGWMDWVGEVPVETVQRIACDSDVWRALLDPATSLPIDVGRTHRTAPEWMLRALHARDRGCRWPGCDSPTPWTDAHHLRMWIHGGRTAVEKMILLCRAHHVMVHEGHWTITFNEHTGEVHITRPDGTPYELQPTQAWTGPTGRRAA